MNLKGAIAAARSFKEATRGDTVPDGVVLDRLRVCHSCPRKEKVSGLLSRISRQMGLIGNKRKIPTSIQDYRCGACSCALTLLAPAKTLHEDTPEQRKLRPSNCWVIALEENERPSSSDHQ